MNKGNTYNKNQQALITCNNILYEGGGTLDRVLYPVGSIYMSVNSTDPGKLFGGKWEQITGKFLYCTTTSRTIGGSATTGSTAISEAQMPQHTHSFGYNTSGGGYASGSVVYAAGTAMMNAGSSAGGDWYVYTTARGSGQGHTHTQNLPPYFTVYCWYRVS